LRENDIIYIKWKIDFIYSFGQNWRERHSQAVFLFPIAVISFMKGIKQKLGSMEM
jgi:hypothetical protein